MSNMENKIPQMEVDEQPKKQIEQIANRNANMKDRRHQLLETLQKGKFPQRNFILG